MQNHHSALYREVSEAFFFDESFTDSCAIRRGAKLSRRSSISESAASFGLLLLEEVRAHDGHFLESADSP